MKRGHLNKGLVVWFLTSLVTATAFGCAWPGAYLKHNWTVESRFEDNAVYDGYLYFTGGTLADPRAIMALKPEYELVSKDWQSVNMTPGQLSQWVTALKKDFLASYNTFANGAELIGENGETVGYYYSVWEFPLVRMADGNSIQVAVPRAEYRSTNMRIEFLGGGDSRDKH